MKRFFRNNGLSLVFFTLFVITLVGQAITGLKQHNEEMIEKAGRRLQYHLTLLQGIFYNPLLRIGKASFFRWRCS